MQHLFDGLSGELTEKKKEQLLIQIHTDVMRLWRRLPQRPDEGYGLFPHAADAFAGVTGGAAGIAASATFLQGYLTSDLDAPAAPLGPPTSATMDFYKRNPADDSLVLIGSGTVYNYDTTLSGLDGTYAKSELIDGQRQLYWLACEPTVVKLLGEDGDGLLDTDDQPLLLDI